MTTASRRVPRLVAETVQAREESPSRRPAVAIEGSPYLAGEVIGDRYKLVRELGRGGMGVVWVAHSLVLGVDIALKLIRVSAAGPAVSSRMAREAHAAARLGHPALVRVFDFGWTSRGDPFLVMELVQGETLSALLARDSRVPAIRAVQMLLPIADGLRLAHDKSIVHRDIKPDNIFIATDTLGRIQPKLLDFGIAKVGPGPHDSKLTQVGVVLGSPEYMSPEQALGADDVDQRTDVWSFSVVLYEMLTGSIPFRRPNYNALMQAIIREVPMPITEYAAGDPSLWAIVERGLAKEPAARWASMTELGEALALWLYEHGIKEDLSGNSIRAVWLDSALSGVRIEVSDSGRPGPKPSDAFATDPAIPRLTLGTTTFANAAVGGGRPFRLVGLAVLLGALAGGVAVSALLSSPSPEPKTLVAPAPSPPPELVANPAPPRPVAREREAPPQAASASPTTTAASPVRSAEKTKTSAPSPTPRSAAPRTPKKNYDFGF